MRRVLFVSLFVIILSVYAGEAIDRDMNNDVKIKPRSPELTSIIRQIDEAQESGDINLFRSLVKRYHELNTPETVEMENGPKVQTFFPGQSGKDHNPDRWTGEDIVVNVANYFHSITMDNRGDRIYLAASRQQNSGDDYKIPVWYSDDGISWNQLYNISWSNHNLYNPSMKIVETPDTDWLYIAFEGYNLTTSDHDILILRSNLVSGNADFDYTFTNDSINEKDPSIDADDHAYGSSFYLHLAFESGDSIAYARSQDKGLTWVDRYTVGPGGATYYYYDPSLAYGTNTFNSDSLNLAVAWSYYYSGFRALRVRRNIYKGESDSWLPRQFLDPPPGHYENYPSLKITRGNYTSAAISFERKDTTGIDDNDLYLYYTYDGGNTWTPTHLYSVGSTSGPKINTMAIDDGLGDYHVFFKGDNDDVRYKEAPYNSLSSGGWTISIPISDGGNVSDATIPASASRNGSPCTAWKIYNLGSDTLKFDALWLQTGIEDEPDISAPDLLIDPNPSAGITAIHFSLKERGNVRIMLYDVTGRIISKLLDEFREAGQYSVNLNVTERPAGIYFIYMETPGKTAREKLTILR